MANIPLKTLTLPGLDNVYTVPYFTMCEVTLEKDNWVGDSAPYNYTVELEGVTNIAHCRATPIYSGNLESDSLLSGACSSISYATYSGRSVTFICQEGKPDRTINLQLEVRQ